MERNRNTFLQRIGSSFSLLTEGKLLGLVTFSGHDYGIIFVPVERIVSRTALSYGRDHLVAPDVLRQCLPLRCPSTRANRCGKQTIDSTWNVIYLSRVA